MSIINPPGIGSGQTWQSPARSLNVTYYNLTGKPILVNIYFSNGGASTISSLVINGVNAGSSKGDSSNGGAESSVSGIVPNGGNYLANGNRGIGAWSELK